MSLGGKGKPWGTDGGRIPLNECCCVEDIAGDSLWLNMDVVNDCCNFPRYLKGWCWTAPPIAMGTCDTSPVRGKVWCCGCRSVPWYSNWLVDEWEARSFNCDCVWARIEGNDVESNGCWIAVCEMGTVALEVAPKEALEVELEVALVVFMSRKEEDISREKSTFSLVFLCLFGPCFRPDALVSMLIVAADESPPLIFCPLYYVTNLSRTPSFSVTATECEHICFGLKFLHVQVALKFAYTWKKCGILPASDITENVLILESLEGAGKMVVDWESILPAFFQIHSAMWRSRLPVMQLCGSDNCKDVSAPDNYFFVDKRLAWWEFPASRDRSYIFWM